MTNTVNDTVLLSSEIRRLDENSTLLGISPLQLMEAAGKSVADILSTRVNVKNKKVVVVAGTGNNGGDGFVTARYLANCGAFVTIILVGKEDDIRTKEAKRNWLILKGLRLSTKLYEAPDIDSLLKLRDEIINADIIIDAIFGIGFRGKIREPYATAIRLMNESKGFKIAIDIPSGIEADTGNAGGEAFKANLTVTFQAMKPGLLKAKEYSGEVIVTNIGIPIEAKYIISLSDVRRCFKKRNIFAKKGDYGRVLIVGGSFTFTGAPTLSALAAFQTGIDLAFILAPKNIINVIRSYSPDIIAIPLKSEDYLSTRDVDLILGWCKKVDVMVIGPGLGLEEETKKAVREIVSKADLPIVIDADGIKALSGYLDLVKSKRVVFTPHSKEFEILTGKPFPPPVDIINRMRVAKEVAKTYNVVFLVKGREDIITDGDKVRLNMTGNALMTVGGTGDTLTGIIAALIAKGIPLLDAACAAAFLNGLAGDIASNHEVYITAYKLIKYIPEAIRTVLKEDIVERSHIYNTLFEFDSET